MSNNLIYFESSNGSAGPISQGDATFYDAQISKLSLKPRENIGTFSPKTELSKMGEEPSETDKWLALRRDMEGETVPTNYELTPSDLRNAMQSEFARERILAVLHPRARLDDVIELVGDWSEQVQDAAYAVIHMHANALTPQQTEAIREAEEKLARDKARMEEIASKDTLAEYAEKERLRYDEEYQKYQKAMSEFDPRKTIKSPKKPEEPKQATKEDAREILKQSLLENVGDHIAFIGLMKRPEFEEKDHPLKGNERREGSFIHRLGFHDFIKNTDSRRVYNAIFGEILYARYDDVLYGQKFQWGKSKSEFAKDRAEVDMNHANDLDLKNLVMDECTEIAQMASRYSLKSDFPKLYLHELAQSSSPLARMTAAKHIKTSQADRHLLEKDNNPEVAQCAREVSENMETMACSIKTPIVMLLKLCVSDSSAKPYAIKTLKRKGYIIKEGEVKRTLKGVLNGVSEIKPIPRSWID